MLFFSGLEHRGLICDILFFFYIHHPTQYLAAPGFRREAEILSSAHVFCSNSEQRVSVSLGRGYFHVHA